MCLRPEQLPKPANPVGTVWNACDTLQSIASLKQDTVLVHPLNTVLLPSLQALHCDCGPRGCKVYRSRQLYKLYFQWDKTPHAGWELQILKLSV